MHITFTPMRRDDRLVLSVEDDALTINDAVFDFSGLGDGETRTAADLGSDWFAGDVTRKQGQVHLMLILPHGAVAPQQTLFPQGIHVTNNGPVDVPTYQVAEVQ